MKNHVGNCIRAGAHDGLVAPFIRIPLEHHGLNAGCGIHLVRPVFPHIGLSIRGGLFSRPERDGGPSPEDESDMGSCRVEPKDSLFRRVCRDEIVQLDQADVAYRGSNGRCVGRVAHRLLQHPVAVHFCQNDA